ncbi:hypothetical protein [Alkalispirochaeta alkalica]|uniref:hypothetical protein n=1 Tax=Alkalispirochaeta alkalica TaxID=46356 RepID=UPI00036F3A2A|nr:hypothetical protein [Alkalispirochaeta alkalica]
MDILQKEYDQFGPWVLVIREEEDIPQQFLRVKDDIAAARYAIKIPINVERRNVRKGMPLYNTLLAFTEEEILLFQRTKYAVDKTVIPYGDLLYFQYGQNLLLGELLLATADHFDSVIFNPVEIEPLEEAVRIIRRNFVTATTEVDVNSLPENREEKSHFYESLVLADFQDEAVTPVEYQPYREYRSEGRRKKQVLQDTLFLAAARELVVINRDKPVKAEDDADYGYRYTHIPYDRITGITLDPDPGDESVLDLSVHFGESRVVFPVAPDFSPERLTALLDRL